VGSATDGTATPPEHEPLLFRLTLGNTLEHKGNSGSRSDGLETRAHHTHHPGSETRV
jgi:hypothetical protein